MKCKRHTWWVIQGITGITSNKGCLSKEYNTTKINCESYDLRSGRIPLNRRKVATDCSICPWFYLWLALA